MLAAALAAGPMATAAPVHAAAPITPARAKLLMGLPRKGPPLVVLDVRTAWEFAHGHVPGARNLAAAAKDFAKVAAPLVRGAPVLVYDDGGTAAAKAANVLLGLKPAELYVLQGGFPVWKIKGFAVER